jgi:hypothetical protein
METAKPIVVNEVGEKILLTHGTEDIHKLGGDIHKYCGGETSFHQISASQQVLSCKRCNLRIPLPLNLLTYGDLREYLKNFQP